MNDLFIDNDNEIRDKLTELIGEFVRVTCMDATFSISGVLEYCDDSKLYRVVIDRARATFYHNECWTIRVVRGNVILTLNM